jgi:hypothetical protein
MLVENLLSYMSSHARLVADFIAESPGPGRAADSDWEMSDSGPAERTHPRPEVSTNPPGTSSSAELAEQARELAKSTARASANIAGSAAKIGIAKLRKRLNENGNQD